MQQQQDGDAAYGNADNPDAAGNIEALEALQARAVAIENQADSPARADDTHQRGKHRLIDMQEMAEPGAKARESTSRKAAAIREYNNPVLSSSLSWSSRPAARNCAEYLTVAERSPRSINQ